MVKEEEEERMRKKRVVVVVDLSERMVRRENGDEREWKTDGGD